MRWLWDGVAQNTMFFCRLQIDFQETSTPDFEGAARAEENEPVRVFKGSEVRQDAPRALPSAALEKVVSRGLCERGKKFGDGWRTSARERLEEVDEAAQCLSGCGPEARGSLQI